MTKRWIQQFFLLWIICSLLMVTPRCVSSAEKTTARQAAVAGSFYPADPKELGTMIDGFLAGATVPEIKDPVIAVVSPHAGYPYSGPVAAYSYAALKGHKFQRVVVIAPSHFEGFDFTSVYEGGAYVTPLGRVEVDKEFAAKLAKTGQNIKLSSRGHAPLQQQGEHALEVQLPFLQRVVGDFKLVPIIMGEQSYESSRALGVTLAKLIRGGDTLIVASSDLSHYHPYEDAVKLDRKTLRAIEEWDYYSMSRNFQSRTWEACGGGPIVAAMIAAERLGANETRVLKYANSGDTSGERSRVVGYGSVVLLHSTRQQSASQPFSLGNSEKQELLKLARKSTESAVKEKKLYEPTGVTAEPLLQERGAFVTLKKRGELRGCIGYTSAMKPLYTTVRDTAAFAALHDPRFSPVSPTELGQLEYEVSVLSPLRRVTDINQINIGEHGLLMKNGNYEGLLLPQVATEQRWDRNTFLEQTCLKASLAPRCWKDENTDVFLFSAVVFGEHGPTVIRKDSGKQPEKPGSPGQGLPRQ